MRTRETLEASQERLFDPDAPLEHWYGPLEQVQVNFTMLRLTDVMAFTHIRSRVARHNPPVDMLAPVNETQR